MSTPWADFTNRVQSDPEQSCWPVDEGAKECRNGHPISRTQMDTLYDWARDGDGARLTDPRTGKDILDSWQVPAHLAVPRSGFDPTGMVALLGCPHGLSVHPLTGEQKSGHTWVRTKYAGQHDCRRAVSDLPKEALQPRDFDA